MSSPRLARSEPWALAVFKPVKRTSKLFWWIQKQTKNENPSIHSYKNNVGREGLLCGSLPWGLRTRERPGASSPRETIPWASGVGTDPLTGLKCALPPGSSPGARSLPGVGARQFSSLPGLSRYFCKAGRLSGFPRARLPAQPGKCHVIAAVLAIEPFTIAAEPGTSG